MPDTYDLPVSRGRAALMQGETSSVRVVETSTATLSTHP